MANYKKYLIPLYLLIFFFTSVATSNSESQSSTNYILHVDVIDAGGNDGNSNNYDLLYSLGQPSIIGNLSSSNYFIYTSYWNALSGIQDNHHISGSGYNYPEAGFRASLSLDVKALSAGTSWLDYYYSKLGIDLESTLITDVSVVGTTITIQGECTVNGVAGYTFVATIIEKNPDIMSVVIYNPDSTIYFESTPRTVSGGDFSVDMPVTCVSLLSRISGTSPAYYSLLQDAYSLSSVGDTIQSRDEVITENLNFNRNVSVNLEGGFDCHYSSGNGMTRINGNMTISDGTVTIGNIILE